MERMVFMKKFLSFVLASGMLLGALPGFAAETTELESVVSEVKQRLGVGEYEEFESEVNTVDGQNRYLLNWSTRSDDQYEYLGVGYSDGVILSYESSYSGEYDSGLKFSKISKSEAEKIAEDFVAKINPEVYQNIEVTADGGQAVFGNSYYFHLQRTYNGIPVYGESGGMSVSKETGEIGYFNLSYNTKITFDDTEGIIDYNTAMTEYVNKLTPKLCYDYDYDYKTKELNVYPKYESQDENLAIDAKTAEVYEIPSHYYPYPAGGSMYEEAFTQNSAADKGFSQAELDEFSKIDGLLDLDSAKKIVAEKKNIGLEERYKLDNYSLYRSYTDSEKYIYSMSFIDETEEKYDYIRVELDAKDGTILSFSKNGDYGKEEQNIEVEKAKAAAALEEFTDNKYKNLEYKESDIPGRITYVRKENGIEVIGDDATFFFDRNDNLTSYNLTYMNIKEFPSVDGVLTPMQAVEKVSADIDFSLFYAVDYEAKVAKPVYSFFEDGNVLGYNLNPFTGKCIDYFGEEIKEDTEISYTDISGHYAEDKFKKLAEHGIGFKEAELLPAKEITQSEYMMLLNELFGYGSDINEIYARAYSKGIIKVEQRQDLSPVTREEAAIFMVREMGAEEFVKYNEIFINPFSDVSENKGYIALLKAMGIISGDGSGNFNPKNTITRGEALIIIYNYLNR